MSTAIEGFVPPPPPPPCWVALAYAGMSCGTKSEHQHFLIDAWISEMLLLFCGRHSGMKRSEMVWGGMGEMGTAVGGLIGGG